MRSSGRPCRGASRTMAAASSPRACPSGPLRGAPPPPAPLSGTRTQPQSRQYSTQVCWVSARWLRPLKSRVLRFSARILNSDPSSPLGGSRGRCGGPAKSGQALPAASARRTCPGRSLRRRLSSMCCQDEAGNDSLRTGSPSGRSSRVIDLRTLPSRINRRTVSSDTPARCQSTARRSSGGPNRPCTQAGSRNILRTCAIQAPASTPAFWKPGYDLVIRGGTSIQSRLAAGAQVHQRTGCGDAYSRRCPRRRRRPSLPAPGCGFRPSGPRTPVLHSATRPTGRF